MCLKCQVYIEKRSWGNGREAPELGKRCVWVGDTDEVDHISTHAYLLQCDNDAIKGWVRVLAT